MPSLDVQQNILEQFKQLAGPATALQESNYVWSFLTDRSGMKEQEIIAIVMVPWVRKERKIVASLWQRISGACRNTVQIITALYHVLY